MVEPETSALRRLVRPRLDRTISSALSRVEVVRTARRLGREDLIAAADATMRQIILIAISPEILELAGRLSDPALRTVDAIHLASAISVREDIVEIVTYDRRLRTAAEAEGFHVRSPAA